MNIQVVCHDNGSGLTRDRNLLKSILSKAGHHVCLTNNKIGQLRQANFDVNIFPEIIDLAYSKQAKYNIFIPNPEWFFQEKELKYMDLVLAKTWDTHRVFNNLHTDVIYTSFTSLDRYVKKIAKSKHKILHSAGKSVNKQTQHTATAWVQATIKMPKLIITQSKRNVGPQYKSRNIEHIYTEIPDNEFKNLQNECLIHLCPSRYEGFGHYIWEAMSAKCVVLTIDKAPMIEFVDETIGFHIKSNNKTLLKYGTAWFTTPDYIRECVEEAMATKTSKLIEKGELARKKWKKNDKFFRTRLCEIISLLK